MRRIPKLQTNDHSFFSRGRDFFCWLTAFMELDNQASDQIGQKLNLTVTAFSNQGYSAQNQRKTSV